MLTILLKIQKYHELYFYREIEKLFLKKIIKKRLNCCESELPIKITPSVPLNDLFEFSGTKADPPDLALYIHAV